MALKPPRATGRFRVPDTYAVGVSVLLRRGLLVATEVTHVRYSRLRDSFVTDQAQGSADQFTIDSGTEVHAGVQIDVPYSFGPRLRGGLWYDPDHSVHFTPSSTAATPARCSHSARQVRPKVLRRRRSSTPHPPASSWWPTSAHRTRYRGQR